MGWSLTTILLMYTTPRTIYVDAVDVAAALINATLLLPTTTATMIHTFLQRQCSMKTVVRVVGMTTIIHTVLTHNIYH